ncbi:DNA polymerase III subunit epsilon [Alteromonas aestuariivivens]|uniref:DNA-directed DNA polymerase n=1 Tax=Alteromonas aestuariivivens TaxID=1938339 RepID=A0A3D8M5G3_9ALTE|nr:exonuclease domain-containing protein [Alteromonas aestuariivivens]RDV24896.1 DNA polymerase III subunit epsilon [Alteromonas aestuariivivens]
MKKILPERYYLAHFHEFLAFFEGPSKALLGERELQFIQQFQKLNDDSQCIIARAANRKYAIINREQFNYAEINQPQQHIDELREAGWLSPLQQAHIRDVAGVLTKADLLELLTYYEPSKGLSSLTKPDLAARLESWVVQQGWPEEFQSERFFVRAFDDVLRFLLFLYFGHTRGRLNQFSMRDLGVMRTRADASTPQARFESHEQAIVAFYYASRIDDLPCLNLSELEALARAGFPEADGQAAFMLRSSFLYKLALKLLSEQRELALGLLLRSGSDAARERWIRERYKDGHRDEVKVALEAILDSPDSENLSVFAEDFYQRKFHQKRTSLLTDMLRSASRSVQLDISQNDNVEQAVIGWYRRRNVAAWRTENRLWRSLFGLTFWPLLYEKSALVNEFDRRPVCLKENRFYASYRKEIDALLQQFSSAEALFGHVSAVAARHFGKVNSLFMWNSDLLELLGVLLKYAPYPAVSTILKAMSEDFDGLSDGFPDIMVLENEQLRFEEIKAPGDQIRRNQWVSIQKLQQAGFCVQVTQVEWVRDPLQPYVVVDIETTGGQSRYHRITEIGMVKLVAGQEVARWQSLINPQRHIPAAITRLTGIDNSLVEDAPVFAEVADEIEEFTRDSVFVAHNVNFDYGFIKQEFARLERDFRRPKLCTVREMRRVEPGLASYSLANLTAHFNIRMERHHRALSDALAAAELLRYAQQQETSG